MTLAEACGNTVGKTTKSNGQNTGAVAATVQKTDSTINESNSYNDIFLSSNAVEQFIKENQLNDTIANAIRNFYHTRNYEYAWFASTGLIEQAFSFHSMYCTEEEKDPFNRSLERELDKLRMGNDTVIVATDATIIKTELQLTKKFIDYVLENPAKIDIDPAALGKYIPAKKIPVLALADSILMENSENKGAQNPDAPYNLLQIQLGKYANIFKMGGWQPIVADGKKYSVGFSGPIVSLIKHRLEITGEFPATDTSAVFDSALVKSLKMYQSNHGLTPNGTVTQDLIKNLNVPSLTRLQQILINMQRMKWAPKRPNGTLILVNIPEFEVYVDSGKFTLFQMGVVVGAAGHNTTMFSGNISQIVFSPYWDVPPSIVKKEIIPGLKKNKRYLEERDMEITGDEGGLPVVRQRPGDKNALGKVKFLFPNSFNIYLHDSPEKGLFNRSERGLSHGCIRLSDAPKLAHYLLRNTANWPREKIDSAMNSGVEQRTKLSPTVPVIITYYTSWVDSKGSLHFVEDLYGQDAKMAAKMFTDPQH